ncbi:MAG: hypothetical protein EA409_03200 [Saprospirales bacterium]|nr:MAG: hypothetical protein EA409_03200 [Saprospirales bacterium]
MFTVGNFFCEYCILKKKRSMRTNNRLACFSQKCGLNIILILLISRGLLAQFDQFNPDLHQEGVLTLKFKDNLHLELENGEILPAFRSEAVMGVLQEFPNLKWFSPYNVEREILIEKWQQKQSLRSDSRSSNIANRFLIRLDSSYDENEILQALRELDELDYAFPIPKPIPLPLAPDFEPNQGYINASPTGIDTRYAWEVQTVRGRGVKIVDIEYNFNPNHKDLPGITVLGGTLYDGFGDNHGTAVLGQLGALDNGWGVTGMAPDADLYFHYAFSDFNILDYGSAVVNSALAINEGDVILIEAQTIGPNYDPDEGGQFGLVPVEWFLPWYEGIVFAVEMGRIVVAAGGNGSQDLDDPVYEEWSTHAPFMPANSSGSIIVGAGAAPVEFNGTTTARSRLGFSNYGSRVNLQGWGQGIYTTGYGTAFNNGDPDLLFTRSFGGTSGASPIVTAAIALVQSASKTFFGEVMTGEEILMLLDSTGMPQTNGQFPNSENIGPFPNLEAAFQAMGLTPCEPLESDLVIILQPTCFDSGDGILRVDTLMINIDSFTFFWNTEDTSLVLENLNPGPYRLFIADDRGCLYHKKVEMKAPDSLSVAVEVVSESCLGAENGFINLAPMGGTAPYRIFLDSLQVEIGTLFLTSGTYSLLLEDSLGCGFTKEVILEKGPEIEIEIQGQDLVFKDSFEVYELISDFEFDSIYWHLTGGKINSGQGENRVEVSWLEEGEQMIILKVEKDEVCFFEKSLLVKVETVSSTSEFGFENTISVFPNPFEDFLKIYISDLDLFENLHYRVFYSDGRLIESGEWTSGQLQLDASNWPAGLLLFQIWYKGQPVLEKRMVKM